MSKPKIILGLDLDYTLFNNEKWGWIKSLDAWHTLFKKVIDLAANDGIEVVFSVITYKTDYDYISGKTAKEFQEFLALHNDNM